MKEQENVVKVVSKVGKEPFNVVRVVSKYWLKRARECGKGSK